jgi:transposase-like protein
MAAKQTAPKTLLEAVKYFSDKDVALRFVADLKWPNGAVCPKCKSKEVTFLKTRQLWKCRPCKKQFSVKVGTIFEDSPIGLDKWLPAMWQVVNCKNGISSYELARALGVTQKTAWFMLHRLRLAMQNQSFKKFGGHVEADETFIGGKARFMHESRKVRMYSDRARNSTVGKTAVMGLLERHGPDGHSVIKAEVVESVRRRELQLHIRKHVVTDGTTTLITDALKSYEPKTPSGWMPSDLYIHKVIDHAEKYVDGEVHTNGVENFWSLLKRSIKGTYVSVEPFHLFRYLDEQCFRFNQRKGTDAARFMLALASIVGRRLTFAQLTGHAPTQAAI